MLRKHGTVEGGQEPRVSPFDSQSLHEIQMRSKDTRQVAELLPWMFPYDNKTVVNKDSAVMATYQFSGPDADGLSMSGVFELMNQHIASLRDLSRKPVTIWWTVHRRRDDSYQTMPMPDVVSQIVDDERRKTFDDEGNYVNRHYVSITMAPDVGLDRFAGRFMHGMTNDGLSIPVALYQAARAMFSDQYIFAFTQSELVKQIDAFERDLKGFVATNPRLEFTRLSDEALGAFLHNCCSPASDGLTSLALPDTPALDVDMCDTEVQPGHDYLHFYSNGRGRIAIAAGIPSARDFWPRHASIKSMDALLKIRGELTISHCFRLASRKSATSFMTSIRRFHENRKTSARSVLGAALKGTSTEKARQNEARSEAAEKTEKLVGKVEMSQESYGHYNLTVLSFSPVYRTTRDAEENARLEDQAYDAAKEIHEQVEAALQESQFVPVQETIHALSAFATTLPGMWRECSRWVFINVKVLMRLLPLRGVSEGQRMNKHLTKETGVPCTALAPFMTEYGTPFWFLAFVLDVGHMLICGRTGYGKTIFMLLCATLLRKYPYAQIFGFDKDDSMRIPTILQGGRYMRFDPAAPPLESARNNPYVLLGEDRHLPFLVRWTVMLAHQRNGYVATEDDRADLELVLRATRNLPKDKWRLSTIRVSLRNSSGLALALNSWTGNAFDAHWFDNESDAFDEMGIDGGWVSMGTDQALKDPCVSRPFLAYASYRIYDSIELRRAAGKIGPTLVMLPEIWHLVDDPGFCKEIGNWIVTMRKKLGLIWFDAQSPEQVSTSAIWPAIRDNVLVRVFVPVEKFSPDTRKSYLQHFGMAEGLIRVIKELIPKRDYLITEQSGAARRVSVPLDPRTLSILRSEQSAQVLFDQHMKSGNPNWRMEYIDAAVARLAESDQQSTTDRGDRHAA